MNLDVGSTVGDYQIIGTLGAGGMGKVFKVKNVISDRIEALKVLLPDLANEPELADRFVREIKVQASLEHPNIAALHTALRVENQLLMLMEFVEGVTLEQKLQEGPIPAPDAVNYISQALSALSYAHQRGVIHRDIKPANMMLTPNGTVKLMDFGIAKAAADRRLTMTGTTMGSLYYMSPEQIRGATNVDGRSDLYSVGVSLYELVTAKKPFDGDSQYAIMSAHLERTPLPPVTIDPNLPEALNDAILISVAKDPGTRFQTADAFRNALASIATGRARPAAATTAAQPAQDLHAIEPGAPETPRSRRGLWVAAGGLGTALALMGLVQFGPWRKTSAAPQAVSAPVTTAAPTAQAPIQPPPQPLEPARPPQVEPARPPATLSARPGPRGQSRPQPVAAVPPVGADLKPAPPQQPPAAPPAVDSATRVELQQAREQLVMLSSRAGAIRSSVQTLQRSQAAGGAGLRGDMVEAATLMGTYLDGSQAALNAGDAASTRNFMDKAERQIEKLEKFLGR